ncbi:MAG: caspase family protein [Saprospiraceae bacterium]
MYNRWLIFLFLFLIGSLNAFPIGIGNKKALIIAVGNYPQASGFRSINSLNDIPLIQNALIKLGFLQKDIIILQDQFATKSNIMETLGKRFLESLNFGDIAYFHFSGHGQQIIDISGDELDGYDEALVPFDASVEFIPGVYEGKNHIIDDELNDVFSKIRTKLGSQGHFLVTIDACHSGTSTRSIGCARGTDIKMAPEDYRLKMERKNPDLNQSEFKNQDESKMASMVAFFGSTARQLNYEILAEDGKNYGALSYAFSKAINNIPSDASYQQLFDRIRLIIQMNTNNQIPEASGILAQVILGGKYLATPNYFTVKEWLNNNNVILEAGFLNGVTPGTIMGFYSTETRDPKNSKPICLGTVKEAHPNTSSVEITGGISSADAEFAWVIIKEENFGNLVINLQLKGEFKNIDRTIFDDLFALPYIKKVKSNPDLVLIEELNKFILITKNDLLVTEFSKSTPRNDLFFGLKSALTEYGQSQFLRKLNQENKQIEITFELVLSSRNGKKFTESFPADEVKGKDGKICFIKGDVIKIKVTNIGNIPAFYTVLDIQPNNKTNVLVPQANESPSDYFLQPKDSFIIPKEFRLDPPLGQELFKLVASKKPINLRPLDQRRSITTQTEVDPFGEVMNLSYYKNESLMTRGINSNVPAGQVNIYSVPFVIQE